MNRDYEYDYALILSTSPTAEQSRVWRLGQLPDSGVRFHQQCGVYLEGHLDKKTLLAAVTDAVRTTFRLHDLFAESASGAPSRQRGDGLPLWREVDLRLQPQPSPQQRIAELAKQEAEAPLAPASGPLWRICLIRVTDAQHLLLVTMHQLLCSSPDRLAYWLAELCARYAAPPLPPAGQSAGDLPALADRSASPESPPADATARPAEALLEEPPLPLGRPSRPEPAFSCAVASRRLTATDLRSGSAHGEEPTVLLLAALCAVLQRYRAPDALTLAVYLGAGDSSRKPRGPLDQDVALLCPDFPEALSFAELVAQIAQALTPADRAASPSAPSAAARTPGQEPRILVELWPAPAATGVLLGTPTQPHLCPLSYDLLAAIRGTARGWELRLHYRADLYAPDAIARLLLHWETLLHAALAHPDQPVNRLPMLSPEELLHLSPPGPLPAAPALLLHELFMAQAQTTPQALAVLAGAQSLTYQQLDSQSNQLAHKLLSYGLLPDGIVALLIDRSLDLIVAILAVLKAGAAFLPLDPAYPKERLAFMQEDSGAALLLSHTRTLATVGLPATCPVLCLDTAAAELSTLPATPPAVAAEASKLAYLIYTSGSTGKPKGVMIEHRSVVHLWAAQAELFTPAERARVLQFSSPSFDALVWELVLALTSGGALCLTRAGQLGAFELPMTLKQHRITMATLPPSMLAQLPHQAFPHLQTLVVAGEACPIELVQRWAPGRRFVNAYGPTEATVCATVAECTAEQTAVRIGRPLRHVRLYVLDAQKELVPVGVPGELYVGGGGVARGYLGRAELTAERFTADRFAEPGRLYRTGDRVRWTPEGELEYLGRLDQQVKLRGYRIELEEIANVLRAQPEVQAAVVIVRGEKLDDKRLVAYVVPRSQTTLVGSDLLAPVRRLLPAFMVPAAVVLLPELPLTANGKLNIQALPAPQAGRGERPGKPRRAPSTKTERELASLWVELLHVDSIDVDENFFSLGGNSLQAIQLAGRIRERLQIEVPLSQFTATFNIAAVAAFIDAQRARAQLPPVAERAPAAETDLPLSFAQEGIWFLQQLAPASCAYNYPAFFRLRGPLDVPALERSLRELSQRHGALRTAFPAVDGRPVQRVLPERLLRLTVRAVAELSPPELEHLLTQEAQRPFDLQEEPLVRASLLRRSETEHLLLLNLHHIITDGWSMNILYRELEWLYGAAVAGKEFKLAPLPHSYPDFSLQQQRDLAAGTLQPQLDFWRVYLRGAPEVLRLPTDRPRPAVRDFRGDQVAFALDPASTQALRELASAEGASTTMVVLAAFSALLYRYTAQEEFLLAVPHFNRSPRSEGVLGCFVHALVLRCNPAAHSSFRALLAACRKSSLQAYDHADLPLEQILKVLQPGRDLNRSPLVQVAFAPQVSEFGQLCLPDLAVEPVGFSAGKAAFDLTLYVWDTPAGFTALLEYSTALFERSTIEAMAGHLTRILHGAARDPDCTIADLPMLGPDELEQLLHQFNPPATPLPELLLHDLFAAQARRTPEALAVVAGGQSLSYQQLDAQSNQLAHKLRASGVRPDAIVALLLPRSPELVVAILAVLKAGAAFLPLDPAYPKDRLAYMQKDSGAVLLLSQTRVRFAVGLPAACPVLCLDTLGSELFALPTTAPTATAGLHNLAYLIYTSGSTGQPKGVLIEHRGLVNLALAQGRAFGVDASSRVLQFAALSFDAAVSELAVTLAAGATLCLPEPGEADRLDVVRLLRRDAISVVTLPPSLLLQLPAESLPALRTLVVAGEPCPAEVVQRWAPGRRFLNAYGPTETTVCATLTECTPGAAMPSIGRPLANVRVYLLDEHRRPVPIGVPAEIYIGGIGVGRGYLNQPELTAQRFVDDPFSPGERLYRSGDRGRWRPDGSIEFLGRQDDQVKVRGYRIELGEIEAALRADATVQAAAVVVREAAAGDRRLYAYVVPADPDPAPAPAIEVWPSVAEYFVYDELLYYAMTHDELRNARYRAAIAAAVPGKTVVDIGTGADAILARMCVEAGARHVYAIELLAESYHKARQRVAALGLTDRITVLHGDATQLTLPEPVEVCVSEIVGAIGGAEGAAVILNRARRLLGPGGVMLPARSLTHIAAISLPEGVMQRPTMDAAARHYVERIFAQVGRRFDLRLCLKGVTPTDLISDIGVFEDLDFGSAEPMPEQSRHRIELTITRPTRLDGLLVWLHLIVGPGEELDILQDRYCWLPVFLPAFGLGVPVSAGCRIVATIERTLCENGLNPDFQLSGELTFPDGSTQEFAYSARQFGTSYQATPFYARALADAAPPLARSPEAFAAELRLRLQTRLPEYMIPSAFIPLPRLPLTPVGKVDRKALPVPSAVLPPPRPAFLAPSAGREQALAALWCEVLEIPQVGIDDRFFEVGGHSLLLVRLRWLIKERLALDLDMGTLFQYPTIRTLAQYLDGQVREPAASPAAPASVPLGAAPPNAPPKVPPNAPPNAPPNVPPNAPPNAPPAVVPAEAEVPGLAPAPEPASAASASERGAVAPIAIIGMAGRFPAADNLDELWQLLDSGKTGIQRFTPEQLAAAGVPAEHWESGDYVPAHGLLNDPLGFDAALLGYSPQDARLMDPQQRLFLECAWESLEHAGYDPARYPGAIGVFGGAGIPRYWLERLAALALRPGSAEQFRVSIGNSRDFLTTRVSFKLGLRGPSVNVQSACSTSLSAVHLACQSLRSGECELALAGGVSLVALAAGGYVYEAGGILSPDGQCRPFDERAGGTVPGSGVALVVLKPLAAALADGDTIHAVIRGSAMNNDGTMKVGYTAPSQEGQAAVISQAHRAAGVTPAEVSYVEAHGTATELGDLIEVSALTQVFSSPGLPPGSCALGSVKGNLGHLDAAAGVTGLIKTALALSHERIPGTVHFERPHPSLKLAAGPFAVSGSSLPWPRAAAPRRAGISSFGLGGTNVHLILQESPLAPPASPGRTTQLLTLSARTPEALDAAARRLAEHLRAHPEQPLADVAFTLQVGRAVLPHRRAVVCATASEAIAALRGEDAVRVSSGSPLAAPKVVFMFPGGGSQQPEMGRSLYKQEPVYRHAIDRCAQYLDAALHCDLRALLFPAPAHVQAVAQQLVRPSLNMAAIFATEYALAQLLQSFGIKPAAVVGHSLGEYAAAQLAGVLTLEDALALVALRGRLCDELPPSLLLRVELSETALRARLGHGLSIAAVNGPALCVVAGSARDVAALEAELQAEEIETRRLPIAIAAHSAAMEPLGPQLVQRAATMALQPPLLPLLSNLTGTWLTEADARDPGYWARHLRHPIRFADSLATLLADPAVVLVEVGPGKALATLATLHPQANKERLVMSTMSYAGSQRSDVETLHSALGRMWCAGVPLSWESFSQGQRRRRIPLPTYPFEHQRYLFAVADPARPATRPSPGMRPELPSQAETAGLCDDCRSGTGMAQECASCRTERPEAHQPLASAPAGDTTSQVVGALWRELLGVAKVAPGDNFFDLGGSSLLAVQLRSLIHQRLQVKLPVHAVMEFPTLDALTRQVESRQTAMLPTRTRATEAAPLVVPIQRSATARANLFLTQPMGGTVYTYRELARHLGGQLSVYGLRALGMEPGEPVLSDIPAIAARYVESIRAVQPHGPYLLGGHSSGGVIAYELAQQLTRQGETVSAIVMLDTVSLAQTRGALHLNPDDVRTIFAPFERLAPEAYRSFCAALTQDSSFRAIILATNRAVAAYQPLATSVPIVYLRAQQRDDVLEHHPELGWVTLAGDSFVLRQVAGNHLNMLEAPHAASVAQALLWAVRGFAVQERLVAPDAAVLSPELGPGIPLGFS